ncbi:hypothetical protein Hdeb2414_s0005g00180071 [Helianthus debilis subsp. tardiflorus]
MNRITWRLRGNVSLYISHTHHHHSLSSLQVIIGQTQPPQAFNEISLKNHKTHVYNKTINLLHLTHKTQKPIFDHSRLLS